MLKPPIKIDGADVIAYIILNQKHQKSGKTSHYINDALVTEFSGLAICKYADSEEFYLFYCNESWECITDTYHETVESAIDQAEFEFITSKSDWIFCNDEQTISK